jgi:hypothetical protein
VWLQLNGQMRRRIPRGLNNEQARLCMGLIVPHRRRDNYLYSHFAISAATCQAGSWNPTLASRKGRASS